VAPSPLPYHVELVEEVMSGNLNATKSLVVGATNCVLVHEDGTTTVLWLGRTGEDNQLELTHLY
jgi:hypothetical protein